MKKCFALLASVIIILSLVVPAAISEDNAPTLVMHFSSPKTNLKVKEQPRITVSITNTGKKPVTLVQPGDGSECGWRTPIANWSVLEADSQAQHPAQAEPQAEARCGNMNPLTAHEVFTLAPGETKELNVGASLEPFFKEGQYKVVYLYSNIPSLKWHDLAGDGYNMKAMAQVKESTACALVSNELLFTVGK